jgi:hypothetical protein
MSTIRKIGLAVLASFAALTVWLLAAQDAIHIGGGTTPVSTWSAP